MLDINIIINNSDDIENKLLRRGYKLNIDAIKTIYVDRKNLIKIKENIATDKNKLNKVQVRTASFTPLNYTQLIMSESENERLILTGTKHLNQDYIFTNRVYERNPKFLKNPIF